MPRNGQSFYIESFGPQDDALIRGVQWLFLVAKASGKSALVVVYQKSNLENITWSQLASLFRCLHKNGRGIYEDVSFDLMTMRNKKYSWDGPALVIYGGQKLLDEVDSLTGAIDVLYIPWAKNDGDRWITTWDATELGKTNSQEISVNLSKVFQIALDLLTQAVNLTTGISHPSDRENAIKILETLIHNGEIARAEDVRQYLIRCSWEPKDAKKVSELTQMLTDGRRPRGSTGNATPSLWDHWQKLANEKIPLS